MHILFLSQFSTIYILTNRTINIYILYYIYIIYIIYILYILYIYSYILTLYAFQKMSCIYIKLINIYIYVYIYIYLCIYIYIYCPIC